jgi:hypothetical protein
MLGKMTNKLIIKLNETLYVAKMMTKSTITKYGN